MAAEYLSAQRLRDVLQYDEETGVFTWRQKCTSSRVSVGDEAGTLREGYVLIGIDGKDYRAHRLAWLYVHGKWPERDIDHRDLVKHHNWIANIRLATKGENQQNQRDARSNSRSKVLGVSWDKSRDKWVAKLKVDGKVVHYTRHKTMDDASAAYLSAKLAFHPFQTVVDAASKSS